MNDVDQRDIKTLLLFAATKTVSSFVFSKQVSPVLTPLSLCGLAYYLHESGKKRNTASDHYNNIRNGGAAVFDRGIKMGIDTVKYLRRN